MNTYPMRLIFREASLAYLIPFHRPQPSPLPGSILNGWLPPPVPPALEGLYVFTCLTHFHSHSGNL